MHALDGGEAGPDSGHVEGEARKLLEVERRERLQACCPVMGEVEADHPVVLRAAGPPDEARRFCAVHETHGAVVPEKEVVGDLADGRAIGPVVPADREEQLVLRRGEPGCSSLLGAPSLEVAEARTQGQKACVRRVR